MVRSNFKQRAAIAYLILLAVGGIAGGLLIPAKSTGPRFVHALLVIVAVGTVALVVQLLAMFVLAAHEARRPKSTSPDTA